MTPSNIYNKLSLNDKYLLAIYALFSVKDSEVLKLKNITKKLTGSKSVDVEGSIIRLERENLLESGTYNWRNNSFDYGLASEHVIPFMMYLYKDEPELCKSVLDKASELKPTGVQRTLWEFITSDFSNAQDPNLCLQQYTMDVEIFMPVLFDVRFMPMLKLLDPNVIYGLVEIKIEELFYNEELADTDYLRTLITTLIRPENLIRDRLLCLCDLYDYTAYGKMPQHLSANNKNHCIIAALHEAYKGSIAQAYRHITAALRLHSRDIRSYSAYKVCLFSELLNFFFILIAYKTGTEEAAKKALTINNTDRMCPTRAAKVLYMILYSAADNTTVRTYLDSMMQDNVRMLCVLTTLLGMYTGIVTVKSELPQWLIMQHEMRKYRPLEGDTLARANAAFGESGLLSSLYRKQEWENVLDELMGRSTSALAENDKRLVYVMDSTNSNVATLKQQTRTKSGAWSAGKTISCNSLLYGKSTCMTAADREILQRVDKHNEYLSDIDIKKVLPSMKNDNRLYVGRRAPYILIDITEEMPYINLQRTHDGFTISSNVVFDKYDKDSDIIITHRGATSINYIRLPQSQKIYYQKLLSLRHFPLAAEPQLRDFLASIGGKIEVNSDLIEGGSTLPLTQGQTDLVMQMRPADPDTYTVSLFVRPLQGGSIRCEPGKGNETIIDSTDEARTRVSRDLAKEKENLHHFEENTGTDGEELCQGALVDAYQLLPILEYAQANSDRVSCEWPEGAKIKLRNRGTTQWAGAIKRNENGWFEIEGSVQIDNDRVMTVAQLLDLAAQSRGRFIKLSNGEFLALSEQLHRQLNSLSAIAAHSKGKMQISPFAAALLGGDILNGELLLTEDEELQQVKLRIKKASTYKPEVPATLNATLRKYQLEGYQWMARLNKWGAGALLADDMGLGKTIQTITFLLNKAAEGPALVVAPASVAPNWKTEMERFAPTLNATILNTCDNRTAVVSNASKGDVVITTYGLLNTVKDLLTGKKWTTICLDEAHIIKNRGAKTSAVAMKLRSDNRIMLTGTPVQNHLGELWSLFQFVNPGLLGSFEDFNHRFITPIEVNGDKERQKDLDRLIKPFMLRRTKDKVAKELPAKEEIYQHVAMTDEESVIYEVMRRKAEALLLAEDNEKVSMTTLAEITRLRQCSCDIRLVDEGKKAGNDTNGSKITALVELLQTIIEGLDSGNGGKTRKKKDAQGGVLVFSQFTSYLALIKQALDNERIPYLYIDGSVDIKTRQKLVEDFQNGTCPVFLISLKAGGLGLNLTRANYVIHMDPWWNPAIEAQATDRAHRIGQKQAVTVYHLIAEGTIEEKIQRLHERKQAMVQNILESTDMSHKLTGEDLLRMVSR